MEQTSKNAENSERVLRLRRRGGEVQVCVSDMFPCFRGLLRDMLARDEVVRYVGRLQGEKRCGASVLLGADSGDKVPWAQWQVAQFIVGDHASSEFMEWLGGCVARMQAQEQTAGGSADEMEFPIPGCFVARYDDKRVKVLK